MARDLQRHGHLQANIAICVFYSNMLVYKEVFANLMALSVAWWPSTANSVRAVVPIIEPGKHLLDIEGRAVPQWPFCARSPTTARKSNIASDVAQIPDVSVLQGAAC